jgi:hypothetical protein
VKYRSNLIAAASGSLGGTVFAHNTGGLYMRSRTVPVNTNTTQQQAVRNALGQLTTAWAQTLSAAQRSAWSVFAGNVPLPDTMGEARNVPPLSWYVKANVPRLQAGVARVDAGPVVWELATFTTPTFTITSGGTTTSMAFTNTDAWANEVGGYMLVYASPPQSVTVNFYAGPYRFAGKVTGAASPPTTPATITLPYVSGPTGSRQFFRVVVTRADGRPSNSFRGFGTV